MLDDTFAAAPVDRLGVAATHATARVPIAGPRETVDAVLESMRGRRFDSAAHVAVCEAGRLLGLLTIDRLFAATGDTPVEDVMDHDPPVVAPGFDQEQAAWTAVRHGETSLAVVDSSMRFVGVIPPARLLAVLLEEHDEDMARLGGFLGSTASARAASQERVVRRLWLRLPWLLVGLVGALLSAGIVGAFDEQLQQQLLIAFFVPGVVYLADAVGVQTVTLIVRGLSVGVSVRRVAYREIVTGALIGALLAATVYPIVLLVWGNAEVAAAVALALLVASSLAAVVALALPWAFNKLGKDPAYGSGPLATVVQDMLSIAIYLGMAQAVVG